ncbi:MAG: hypothetical protein SPK84_07075 [Synergistales bacterium]|nr:hypothetical protein [Synergistales bacterium]
MSKKIFVLLLSFFVMMFVCSVAMGASNYKYVLIASDDNYDYPELYDDDPEEGIAGYNYSARYRLPQVSLLAYLAEEYDEEEDALPSGSYTISWSIVSASPDLKLTIEGFDKDKSSDIAIVSGILPDTSGDYGFYLTATVATVKDATHKKAVDDKTSTNFDEKLIIAVGAEERILAVSGDESAFGDCVVSDSGIDLNTVTPAYSVTVSSVKNAAGNSYKNYIASDDGKLLVNLPTWLTATVESTEVDEFGDEQVTSIKIKFKEGATVKDSTKAVVRVPLTDEDESLYYVFGWDVTYKEPKEERPFGVSGDKEVSFNFPVDRTTSKETKTITYNAGLLGESIKSCDISGTGASLISADWTAISGDTGTITITVTIPEATSSVSTAAVTSATYDGDLVFWGSQGSSFDVSVTITVNTNTLSITADTASFSLEAGASKDITLSADATVLSWKVGSTSSDITAEIIASNDTSATVRVTAGESATAGTRTITINATGENNISGSVTLTVTVTESVFTITADKTALELEAGDYDTVTVTAKNGTVVSWDVEADDGITCDITESNESSADIEITVDDDTEDGEYIATVTAEDEDGNTAEVSITVTVTSVSGDAYSVTLTASSTAVTLPTGGSRDITLTAGGTHSGDLTWTHSAAPTGLVVNVYNTSNTSATARIGVYTTATAGTKSPITVTATDKAGNSASVSIIVTVTSNTSTDVQQDYINNHSSATPIAVSESVFNAISNTVSTFFRSLGINVSVASLPTSAFSSTTKTVADSAIRAEYAGTDEIPILAFPEILASAITESKVYMFAVDYAQLKAAVDAGLLNYSDPIFIHMRPQTSSTGSINASATADADSALFDNNGNEIIKMPNSDNGINIAAYLEANTAYSPVITAVAASSDVISSDSKLGPANVGCNGGFGSLFGLLGMAFTASALYLRKRKD